MHKYSFAKMPATLVNKLIAASLSFCLMLTFLPLSSHAESLQQRYHVFLSNYYLSDTPLSSAGKIIASTEGKTLISVGDTIYVSPTKESPMYYAVAHVQSIPYGKGKNANHDYLLKRLGTAKLSADHQDILIMQMTDVVQEIGLGDHILPADLIDPKLPDQELIADRNIAGIVMQLEDATSFAGTYQSVLLNLGYAAGLKLGMRVYFESTPQKIDGYNLSGGYLGQGFIYRLASHHAIALVTNAKQEILVGSIALTQLPKRHVK